MNLSQMRAFNAVATQGSFSAAARFLGVSQPAVTAQVKALEQSCDAKLFDRTSAAVALTDHGRDLLPLVRRCLLTLEDVTARVSRSQTLENAFLTIGICGPYLAMPLIAAFSERYPGVRLSVRLGNSAELVRGIAEHRLDLAVATLFEPEPALHNLHLVTQRVVMAAPRTHSLARGGRIRVSELGASPIVIREPGSMTRAVFERAVGSRAVDLSSAVEVASREALKEAVACGLGLGIVLDHEFGRDDRLVMLEIEDADTSVGEYLFCSQDIAEFGAVRAFLQVTKEMSGTWRRAEAVVA